MDFWHILTPGWGWGWRWGEWILIFFSLARSHCIFITTPLRLKISSKLIFDIVCASLQLVPTLLSPYLMITGLHSRVSCTDYARILGHNRTSMVLTILLNSSFDFVNFPYSLEKLSSDSVTIELARRNLILASGLYFSDLETICIRNLCI